MNFRIPCIPVQDNYLSFFLPQTCLCSVSNGLWLIKLVILTQRVHPFPFRTRKLSSAVATILVWRRTGKIAHCQHRRKAEIVGVFSVEGPPVPIPNTEVKLYSGDNTCLATDREDSSMPTHKQPFGLNEGLRFYCDPLKISLV